MADLSGDPMIGRISISLVIGWSAAAIAAYIHLNDFFVFAIGFFCTFATNYILGSSHVDY